MHTITIRGKTYPIHLGIGTIADIQERYGEIGKIPDALTKPREIPWLFAALINDGLRVEAYEFGKPATQVTEEQIATLLELKDANDKRNLDAIVACINDSMGPELKNMAAGAPTQTTNGTSTGEETPANG